MAVSTALHGQRGHGRIELLMAFKSFVERRIETLEKRREKVRGRAPVGKRQKAPVE